MTELADILAQAQRPETSVTLCLRGDLAAEYRDLERRLATANRTPASLAEPSDARRIAERMTALEAEMAASEATFRLQAMKALDWSAYRSTLPERAKDDTDETYQQRWFGWVCELVSRCAVDPKMTADDVAHLVDHLSGRQWDDLSNAAWALNASEVTVPFSVAASVLIRSSEPR